MESLTNHIPLTVWPIERGIGWACSCGKLNQITFRSDATVRLACAKDDDKEARVERVLRNVSAKD